MKFLSPEFLFGLFALAIPVFIHLFNFRKFKKVYLTNHALFLPMLYKMALSGFADQRMFETIGSNNYIYLPVNGLKGDNIVKIKKENLEIIPEVKSVSGGSILYFADQIQQPGFYTIKNGITLLAISSFNYNREESDMRFYDVDALKDIFKGTKFKIINANVSSINPQIKESLLGTSLWKLCLILALIFLLIEILLIRFYNRHWLKQTTV
jgi:hypothetical protein